MEALTEGTFSECLRSLQGSPLMITEEGEIVENNISVEAKPML